MTCTANVVDERTVLTFAKGGGSSTELSEVIIVALGLGHRHRCVNLGMFPAQC